MHHRWLRNTTRPAGTKARPQRFPLASKKSGTITHGSTRKCSGMRTVGSRVGCKYSISNIAVGSGNTKAISKPTLISMISCYAGAPPPRSSSKKTMGSQSETRSRSIGSTCSLPQPNRGPGSIKKRKKGAHRRAWPFGVRPGMPSRSPGESSAREPTERSTCCRWRAADSAVFGHGTGGDGIAQFVQFLAHAIEIVEAVGIDPEGYREALRIALFELTAKKRCLAHGVGDRFANVGRNGIKIELGQLHVAPPLPRADRFFPGNVDAGCLYRIVKSYSGP